MFASLLKKNKFYVCLAVFFFVSLLSVETKAQDQVKVKGDGFEIGEKYIEALADFYETANFTTYTEQYMNMAARIKVFSLEARELNLDPADIDIIRLGIDFEDPINQEFLDDFTLAEAYLAHVESNYQVDEKVIESYYRSNPEKFRDGPWGGADILPLDQELKNNLRWKILQQVRNRIVADSYSKLKDKYEVHFFD